MIYTRQAADLPYGIRGFVIHDENGEDGEGKKKESRPRRRRGGNKPKEES